MAAYKVWLLQFLFTCVLEMTSDLQSCFVSVWQYIVENHEGRFSKYEANYI